MDAERITRALRGQWYGRYGTAMCPAHANTRTPALSLSNGSDGRLLMYCHAGCAFSAIVDALHGLELIVRGSAHHSYPVAGQAHIQGAHIAIAKKRERQALALWRDSVPIYNTLAETYLRSRGITADLPDTVRFNPETWHGPTAQRLPALVALIEGAGHIAVHRTYLAQDGHRKAGVVPVKMMLGAAGGGAVRLAQGGGPLVVVEGIETGLSLASGLLATPATIWAGLSTSGLIALRLPPNSSRLTIAADGDVAGYRAAQKLAERASALGWSVSLLPAPNGRDWNDILMMKGATKCM